MALGPSVLRDDAPVVPHEDAPATRFYRFVDCDEIKDAFVRAFSTWSANHPHL